MLKAVTKLRAVTRADIEEAAAIAKSIDSYFGNRIETFDSLATITALLLLRPEVTVIEQKQITNEGETNA